MDEYKTSYGFLNDYLVGILANMSSTVEVNRVDFLAKFTRYYDARQTLINNISSTIKSAADKAQADANVALGNAKIFYQTTAPTKGMKENDLWYDTDDQNHPYIYRGSQWVSARDKIFETEGKNLVYFTNIKPAITDKSKEGDVWFDTGHNNNQYVLVKNQSGNLEWKLATDAGDKIQNGRIVINGNTTFNGDATIVSTGSQEQTIIKGGSITFTRNGVPITAIRNMRFGEIETDSSGKGFVSFPGFKNMKLLLSIKSFAIGQNVRSLGCYANLVNLSENKYQCFIYGTQSQLGTGTSWVSARGSMSSSYSKGSIIAISLGEVTFHFNTVLLAYYEDESTLAKRVSLSEFNQLNNGSLKTLIFSGIQTPFPQMNVKIWRTTSSTTALIYSKTVDIDIVTDIQRRRRIPNSNPNTPENEFYYLDYNLRAAGNMTLNINDSTVVDKLDTLGYRVEATLTKRTITGGFYRSSRLPTDHVNNREVKTITPLHINEVNQTPVEMKGVYNAEKLENLTGHGTLFYLAFEE